MTPPLVPCHDKATAGQTSGISEPANRAPETTGYPLGGLTPAVRVPGSRVPAAAHGCRPDHWSVPRPRGRPGALRGRRRHRPNRPGRATRLSVRRRPCLAVRCRHRPAPAPDWPAYGHRARPGRLPPRSPAAACPAAGARAAGHRPCGHAGPPRPAPPRRVRPSRSPPTRRQAEPGCRGVELILGKGAVFGFPRIQSGTKQLVPEPVTRRLAEPCRHADPLPGRGLTDAFTQLRGHRYGEPVHLGHAYHHIAYEGITIPVTHGRIAELRSTAPKPTRARRLPMTTAGCAASTAR